VRVCVCVCVCVRGCVCVSSVFVYTYVVAQNFLDHAICVVRGPGVDLLLAAHGAHFGLQSISTKDSKWRLDVRACPQRYREQHLHAGISILLDGADHLPQIRQRLLLASKLIVACVRMRKR